VQAAADVQIGVSLTPLLAPLLATSPGALAVVLLLAAVRQPDAAEMLPQSVVRADAPGWLAAPSRTAADGPADRMDSPPLAAPSVRRHPHVAEPRRAVSAEPDGPLAHWGRRGSASRVEVSRLPQTRLPESRTSRPRLATLRQLPPELPRMALPKAVRTMALPLAPPSALRRSARSAVRTPPRSSFRLRV